MLGSHSSTYDNNGNVGTDDNGNTYTYDAWNRMVQGGGGLPFAADWRWMLSREDTPWYRSMRLFRQEQAGYWQTAFRKIADELEDRLAGAI
jgi:hypothetical protein